MPNATPQPARTQRMLEMVKRAAPVRAEGEPAPGDTATPVIEDRVRSFVASTEAVDSYNTVIKSDAWEMDRFEKNPIVFFGHRQRELPIGKGAGRVDSGAKQFLLDIDFFAEKLNALAEQALRILDQGVMGCSVGFEPLSWEYNKERETGDEFLDYWYPPLDYTKVRLLEVSVVGLPANPDAFPVGRDAVQARFLERLDLRRAPPLPPASPVITADQMRALVNEVVSEEVRAIKARTRGTLSGV
jgi:hypothetical protein